MSHAAWHIICGTAGEDQGEIDIRIYDGSAANFAIAVKPEGLAAYGMSQHEIEKFTRKVDKYYHKLIEHLERCGVPYTYHEPHEENFPDHE